jgi:hypothetical protein
MYSFGPYGPSRVIPKPEARCFGEKTSVLFFIDFISRENRHQDAAILAKYREI